MAITITDSGAGVRRTLKNNHLYLVDTPDGFVPHQNQEGLGLYYLDTRFLSGFQFSLNNTKPVPLLTSSSLGYLSTLIYTNQAFTLPQPGKTALQIPQEILQIKRESILFNALYEKYTLIHYHEAPIPIRLDFSVGVDFRDIFEVRHLAVPIRGQFNVPHISADQKHLHFSYLDATGLPLETHLHFRDWTPDILPIEPGQPVQFVYEAHIPPLTPVSFHLEIHPKSPSQKREEAPSNDIQHISIPCQFQAAIQQADQVHQVWHEEMTTFSSDNDDFNELLDRSQKDLLMLLTQYGEDTYIAAGIPWYTCLFGRDSLITARDSLILNPNLAKATLNILAKHQGKEFNPHRDEAPGKILHELRVGELARTGEIPHTPYYGSVDATPLWIILLHDYYCWTHDFPTLEELWPYALEALAWIDSEMAKDPRGYLSYLQQAPKGLLHQGWKDSHNSAMDANGLAAIPPIALSEVQGYVYCARRKMARLADILGQKGLRSRLKQDNLELKHRFNRDFWLDKENFCALGLDYDGKPLNVISSNPGHCLESGIFTIPHAKKTMYRLMESDLFNGWGIRTLSANMKAYNPMSYHNGSIWPHDNAMIARGFSEMGHPELVEEIFGGLFEAARQLSYRRLPELFCGFSRDPHRTDPPVRYPVACSPQAWAASSVFSLTLSLLNLHPNLDQGLLKIQRPHLPHWVNQLHVKNLKVGNAILDLDFRRAHHTVLVDVHKRQGKLNVILEI